MALSGLRRGSARGLALLVLGWALYGFGNEVRISRFRARWGMEEAATPSGWRMTSRIAVDTLSYVERITADLPAGTRVAVMSDLDPGQHLFLRLWIAYTVPRLELFEVRDEAALGSAGYLLVVPGRRDGAGRELLVADPLGTFYRLPTAAVADASRTRPGPSAVARPSAVGLP